MNVITTLYNRIKALVKRDGKALVDVAVAKFDGVLADLEKAQERLITKAEKNKALVKAEEDALAILVATKKAENEALGIAHDKAVRIHAKISELLA